MPGPATTVSCAYFVIPTMLEICLRSFELVSALKKPVSVPVVRVPHRRDRGARRAEHAEVLDADAELDAEQHAPSLLFVARKDCKRDRLAAAAHRQPARASPRGSHL